jgi:putative ABC transport system permease protein
MIAPRWRKILKDIIKNPGRSFLVILIISIGVFSAGFLSTFYIRALGDMDKDMQSVNPHSAIIYTTSYPDDLLFTLAKVPGVDKVEGRSSTSGVALLPGDREIKIGIVAIPPPGKMQVDKLVPAEGYRGLALGNRQILIEKSSITPMGLKIGDSILIKLSNAATRKLVISGFVHDPTAYPYSLSKQISGYVNADTLEWLDGSTEFNQVYLTVSDNKKNLAHINNVAALMAKKIENSGRQVYLTLVYQPGVHFAAPLMQAVIIIMSVLGLVVIGLSAILVANTVDAVISQQVRQIGVMKAVGASAGQITSMYLMMVTFYGLLAMLIAVPASIYLANFLANGMADFLSYRPGGDILPPFALVMQVIVGLAIPILATLVPVVRGGRMTVREAITSYGLGAGHFGQSWFDRLLEHVRGLPRPLLLSLRNTFRRKGRLTRTLIALILAGTIFIAVINLRASMNITIEEMVGYVLSDANIGFSNLYRSDKIIPLAMSVPGVSGVEAWGGGIGNLPSPDGKSAIQLEVIAPPANSKLIKPTITSGRWLVPSDQNAIVIGNSLQKARPDLKVGDALTFKMNDQDFTWIIVGTFRTGGNSPFPPVYVPYEYTSRILGASDKLASIRVVTDQHDAAFQTRVIAQLQQVFKNNGVEVAQALTAAEVMQQNTQIVNIIIMFLGLMAIFIAIVGGLGLASTMSLNVIERIREIGVMRAIGASNRSIQSLVIVEGMLIGVISWIVGTILAIPLGWLFDIAVGNAILQSQLNFAFGWDGIILWLLLILIISAVASSLPARSASRLTVREVLAYEG